MPKEATLEMAVLPLVTFDQKHALAANVGVLSVLGDVEPKQNLAKRIAQLRSIFDLQCRDLISKSIYWIALQ